MWPALKSWWLSLAGEINPDGRRDWGALIARAPLAVSVVLSLAIVTQAATTASDLLGESLAMSTAAGGVIGPERGRQRNAQPLTALNAISAAHLFGEAQVSRATGRTAVSRTPLLLTGTIATENPAEGFAIIGASATSTHVFHTGSQAAPGIRLLEVYPQRVVLLEGDERVVLVLPHGALGNQPGSVQFAAARGPAEETVADDSDIEGEGEAPAQAFTPPPISNGATIIRAFALRPVSIGGERGVRIMATGLNSKTLAELGLAPGDVITAINGVPVGSPHTPDLNQALQQGGASLMVDRNGEQTSVTIDPGSAASAAQAYNNQQDSEN
jgi:type II secretory pathway component PulC